LETQVPTRPIVAITAINRIPKAGAAMSKALKVFGQFLKDEDGAALIEYTVLLMRRSTNLAILTVAVILGALAAFLARSWLQSHSERADADQTVSIVVANRALAFGLPISADDVREIAWPAKSRPQGAFANFAELAKDGRRIVISPFVGDEPIIASKVSAPNQRASFSAVIEKGKRAVTVAVDDVRGVAGFIFPGDFVDVVLTRTNNSNGPQDFAEVILQHVKVLAIDQMAGER
jgi:pilus assembly protein CpaB